MKNSLFILFLIFTINGYSQTKNDTLTAEEKKKIIAQKRYDELKKRSDKVKATIEGKKNAFKNDTIDYGNRDQEIMKNIMDRYKTENDSLKNKEGIYQTINL